MDTQLKPFSFMEVFQIVCPDKTYRDEVIGDLQQAPTGDVYEIKQIIWSSFWDLFDELSQVRLQELLNQVKKGEVQLDGEMMKKAQQTVWQEFQDILSGKAKENEHLEEIRDKIKKLIEETKVQKVS